MKLSSPVFNHGEAVPDRYTCAGANINPPLKFTDVSPACKSLTLIVEDPDAPGKPWIHWLVYNIPENAPGIDEHSVPSGAVDGIANGGTHGYEGPCPPSGTHHYHFTLYALDTMLNLPETADKQAVEEAMKGHVLDTAELIGISNLDGKKRVYPTK